MRTSASRERGSQRGVAMVVALFIVLMLLLVALAVLSNTSYTASNALGVENKNQTFDTAEAGLNFAQWTLDQNLSMASTTAAGTPGSLSNGYSYKWEVVNQLNQPSSATVTDPNPLQSQSIVVPSGQAFLAGWASAIHGGRTVYVEEMVKQAPDTILPKGAIVCGKTGQISHQQITDTSGNHAADIRCGTITSSGGGQIPDGNSYATCSVPGCNAITGYDHHAYISQVPPTFLTAAQLAAIRSSALSQAQSGGSNYYTAGNFNGSGTIGSNGANCVAYIGGNLTLNGNSSLKNYCATTVVMGDVTIGGNADYQALPASLPHIMYVFGTGGTVLHGTPTTVGTVYVANADVTINGGGHGSFTGSVITPNNVTMNGGGNANFFYDSTQTNPPVSNLFVVALSKWEY